MIWVILYAAIGAAMLGLAVNPEDPTNRAMVGGVVAVAIWPVLLLAAIYMATVATTEKIMAPKNPADLDKYIREPNQAVPPFPSVNRNAPR